MLKEKIGLDLRINYEPMAGTKFDRNKFKATPIALILLEMSEYSIQSDIASYKDYIYDTQKVLKKRQTDFNAMIDELHKKHPNDGAEIGEAYETQYSNHNEFFPAVFNNSTLLSLYAFFEYNLNSICETVDKYGRFELSIKDLSGNNYIDKSRKYMEKVIGIELSETDQIWSKIMMYQYLRNRIVHNNSSIMVHKKVDITKQPHYSTIAGNSNLRIDMKKGTFSIVNYKFNEEFCDIINEYLIDVVKRLRSSLDEWRRVSK